MGKALTKRWAELGRLLRKAGPYVVLEVVLPGGTLFALLLYLHRSGRLRELAAMRRLARAVDRAGSDTFDQLAYVWQPAALG